jgi:hypothetical protein
MIAHVSGIPVEELVSLALAGGTGGLLVVRVWLRMRNPRSNEFGTERPTLTTSGRSLP